MGDEKSPEEPKIPDDLGVIPSSQPAQNGVEPNETEKAASRQDSHSPPTDPSMNSSPLHKSVMIVGSGENDAGSSSDENSASRPTSPSGTSAESENGRPRTSTLVDRHRRIRKNSVIRVALGGYSGDTATDVHRKMTNKANLRLLTKVVDGQHPNGDVSASSTSPSLPDSSHGELAVDTPLNLVGYPHLTQPNFESSPLVLSSAASTASLGGLARSESTASMFGDNFIYANSNFSVPPSTASVLLSQTSPYSSLRKTRSDSQPDDYYLYRKANVVRDEAWEQENLRQPGGFTAHFAAKHLNTEQFIAKHGYKTKLAKYQGYMDRAFAMVQAGANTIALQGMEMLAKVMARAWSDPKFGHDLAYDLCEYINVNGYLDFLLKKYTEEENEDVELAAGEQYFPQLKVVLIVFFVYFDVVAKVG